MGIFENPHVFMDLKKSKTFFNGPLSIGRVPAKITDYLSKFFTNYWVVFFTNSKKNSLDFIL